MRTKRFQLLPVKYLPQCVSVTVIQRFRQFPRITRQQAKTTVGFEARSLEFSLFGVYSGKEQLLDILYKWLVNPCIAVCQTERSHCSRAGALSANEIQGTSSEIKLQ